MNMRRFLAAALLCAVSFATTRCNLLLLDTDGFTATCGFAGDTETECGRCIASNCRDVVDQCCEHADCRPALVHLDQCATSSQQECAALAAATNPTAAKAGACVIEACNDVCVTSAPPGVTRCSGETCPEGEGCDDGYCRERCIDDKDCGPFRECSGNFCSEPVGTSCSSSSECNSSYCLTLDNHAVPVPGYCSMSCFSSTPCPTGYECLEYKCYEVSSEGELCPRPTTSPCGACVLDRCGSRLTECCEQRPECNWVIGNITQCDAERTYETCNELYDNMISEFADYQLIGCIMDFCESACWNPCPGEGC